ncbi:hypothetical protein TYRP_023415 [Tyrophagus putrescentiae]|nr:hypothetical protein TYRP_023415 [Tyrophagus putrescentiae]
MTTPYGYHFPATNAEHCGTGWIKMCALNESIPNCSKVEDDQNLTSSTRSSCTFIWAFLIMPLNFIFAGSWSAQVSLKTS